MTTRPRKPQLPIRYLLDKMRKDGELTTRNVSQLTGISCTTILRRFAAAGVRPCIPPRGRLPAKWAAADIIAHLPIPEERPCT